MSPANITTFKNPLLPSGQDPYVTFHKGWYYYCHTKSPLGPTPIYIKKSKTLIGFKAAKSIIVWEPPKKGKASTDIWAPELHFINNNWYIYFAAWSGIHGDPHQMYVLEGTTENPQERFILKNELHSFPETPWAIDGTVLNHKEALYYFWSGKDKISVNKNLNSQGYTHPDIQNIYVSRMENPWTLTGKAIKISTPTYKWEKNGPQPVNEGPQLITRGHKIFLIYSASNAITDDYCLGMLTNITGDILNQTAWVKNPKPVFCKTDSVYAPGHASFTKSLDGKENWIVFHNAKYSGSGFDRQVNMQKFFWLEDNTPHFGKPINLYEEITLPSSESNYINWNYNSLQDYLE